MRTETVDPFVVLCVVDSDKACRELSEAIDAYWDQAEAPHSTLLDVYCAR